MEQDWLEVCCDRLRDHSVFKHPLSDAAREVYKFCWKYVWSKETTLAKMANDLEIRAEIAAINTEYAIAEMDGLEDL
jgi:hypothetical protein